MSYIKSYNKPYIKNNTYNTNNRYGKFNKFNKNNFNKTNQLTQIYSNQKIKQILIDYIYDNVDLQSYNYKVLNSKDDLKEIDSQNYVIMPNYHGFSYLLIFMKNKDRYYSYLVDRQTLAFNKSKINIDTINIIPIEVNLDNKIYDGTIFDGIYHFENDKKYFIINDVYYFRGENFTKDIIKHKLINIESYLKYYYEYNNNIDIIVNNYVDFKNIKETYNNYRNNFYKIQIRGLCFYPFISGTKLIFIFENFKNKQIKSNYENKTYENKTYENKTYENKTYENKTYENNTYENKTCENKYCIMDKYKNDDIYLNFETRKTEIDDIYKLFLIYPVDTSKNKFKTLYIDFACIPDIKTSKFCKDIFNNSDRKILNCKFDNNRNKWIPIKISELKYPSKIDDLHKYFNKN
jgi:hypothetical protein